MNRQSTYQNNTSNSRQYMGCLILQSAIVKNTIHKLIELCNCFVIRISRSCAFIMEGRCFKSFKKACYSDVFLIAAYLQNKEILIQAHC